MAQTVLITGASGGIGKELAFVFAEHAYNLVLVARGADALQTLSEELKKKFHVAIDVIALDLSQPDSAQKLFDEVTHRKKHISILVNNAGFATSGKFSDIAFEDDARELNVNIVTLTLLTKLFLPGMIQDRCGKILNVASTAAFLPGPLMAVYYASKAYVLSFSNALYEELKGTGIEVTVLCPGATDTGFAKRAHVETSQIFSGHLLSSRDVAVAGYTGLMKNQRIVFADVQTSLVPLATRLLPTRFLAILAKKANTL